MGEALATFGARYVVIDTDPDTVAGLRARSIPCLFGDAAQRHLLEQAGVSRANLVIVTLPVSEHARLAVRASRELNPAAPILARAHARADADGMRRHGATEVIQPEIEAAAAIIDQALRLLPSPPEHAAEYLARFHEAMETARVRATPSRDALPIVREVPIPAGEFANLSLRDAHLRERFGVTVVAIIREEGILLNPAPDTTLRVGDRVRLFGLDAQIDDFLRETTAI